MNPELRDKEKVVVLRVLPVDNGELLGQGSSVVLASGYLDTVANQRVDLLVCTSVVHDGARPSDLGDRLFDCLGGHSRIEAFDSCPQPASQEDFGLVIATERSLWPQRLVVRVDALPSEVLEQIDRGLLDELIFRVLTERHAAACGIAMSRSVTSISPEMRHGSRRSRVVRNVCRVPNRL